MSSSDSEQPPPTHQPYGQSSGQPSGQSEPGQQNPYAAPSPYQQPYQQQPPYGQPQYGQPAYGQPAYGQPAYGQPGYGYRPPPANHPSATTALVLSIVGLAGILACGGITLVLSPFAWVIGGRAVREIDAAPPGTYGGREQANAGRIMGIIGTVLLILGVLAIALFIVGIVLAADTNTSTTYG